MLKVAKFHFYFILSSNIWQYIFDIKGIFFQRIRKYVRVSGKRCAKSFGL